MNKILSFLKKSLNLLLGITNLQKVFLFLLMCNVLLGPKVLDELNLVNLWISGFRYEEFRWEHFFSIEHNLFYWLVNIILIAGCILFKKTNEN